jgi:hypothetical protein
MIAHEWVTHETILSQNFRLALRKIGEKGDRDDLRAVIKLFGGAVKLNYDVNPRLEIQLEY